QPRKTRKTRKTRKKTKTTGEGDACSCLLPLLLSSFVSFVFFVVDTLRSLGSRTNGGRVRKKTPPPFVLVVRASHAEIRPHLALEIRSPDLGCPPAGRGLPEGHAQEPVQGLLRRVRRTSAVLPRRRDPSHRLACRREDGPLLRQGVRGGDEPEMSPPR